MFLHFLARRPSLSLLLVAQIVLGCGCTAALWNKETFAQHYRPASPTNVHLFYSKEHRDILVQYDELNLESAEIRTRCYWLEPNVLRANEGRKPHFASLDATNGLMAVRVIENATDPSRLVSWDLHAVAGEDDDFFTLYAGEEKLDPYQLPIYTGPSQRVKQVLLTPFAVAVDLTIVGAAISIYAAPQILAGLSH